MSTTIDERVVEMRFDNSNFEKNTRETMSTLDKLKQKLNLTGASKGLENISSSARKVDMSGMSNAIETVHNKFSALEVMGITALANITNSAVNAGKRFVKALTIDPVMDGWQEYEMTLNSIQTTMAGTGKTAEEVEKELKKLDEYADKTVYSTSDMLNNLPKFTNAGVELEKATEAMIGIANATALAGGDAGKASIAFYNLGQAIGTGYLTRMDYNSINNAGIATMEWKNQMVEAAIAQGTLTKVGENQYKAGKKTLTLQQLFIDGLQEQWATTDVMMKVFGDYGNETTEIGKKSYAAAQDIKTFSMMMDSLKATAGTGWKDTWQIIFGGLDDAKKFWTGLNNFISGIITGMADFRNNLLRGALTFDPFKSLMDKLNGSGIGKAIKNVKNISKSLEYYQEMVNKIWRGDYKNQPVRKGLLENEGHNFSVLQTLVNKGYQYKLTTEDVAEAEKKFGISVKETTEALEELSDEKLKDLGLTDEEIALYRELEDQSKKTGKSIDEILESMEKRDGRTLLIESFANAGKGLVSTFKAIKDAFKEIFMPEDVSVLALKLYNAIDALNRFSQHLVMSDETADKLKRTFKGLFAALDMALTIISGPIKIAFKLLTQILGYFDLHILDVTAGIGDVIVGMRDWLDSIFDITAIMDVFVPFLKSCGKAIGEWFKKMGDSEVVKRFSDYLTKAKEAIVDWFSGLKNISGSDIIEFFKSLGESIKNMLSNINKHFNGAPGDILSGLINGLRNGISKVKDAVIELATNIINKFKEILGIHSPSTVFFMIGSFIIAGLVGGLLASGDKLGETVGGIATKIGEFFTNIDWNKIFTAGMSTALLLLAKKLVGIVDNLTAPLGGLADLFSGAGEVMEKAAKGIGKILVQTAKVVKGFAKILSGIAFEHRTEGIKNLAWSLLILVGAIAILTTLDIGEMWNAVAVVAALAGILWLLSLAVNEISQASITIDKNGVKTTGLKSSLMSIGLALLAMAAVVKMIGGMSPDQMKQGFIGLAGAVIALGALLAAYGLIIKGKAAQNMDKAGKMIRKMATTLLLMVAVVKLVSFLKPDEMWKGAAFATGFLIFTAGLMAISMIPGKGIDKIGKTVLKISVAMLMMAAVVKIVSGFGVDELRNGIIFAAAFLAFVAGLTAIGMIPGKGISKVGKTLLGISAAMLIMVVVIKLISGMEWDALGKGAVGIIMLGAIVAGLMYMLKLVGPDVPKLAGTLLAMSVAIGILAAVAIVLSLVDIAGLAKGVIAVGILGSIMALMIRATKGAQNVKGALIAMAAAIAIMAIAIAGLSFIDVKDLIPATLAMAALMGMFVLIEKNGKNINSSLGPLIVMTVAIGLLAGAVVLIAKLAPENAISSAAALSILMLTMSATMKIVSSSSATWQQALIGIGLLLAICVPLVAIAGILNMMENTDNAIASATALSLLLGVMAGVLLALTVVGTFAVAALAGIGTLAAAILAIGGLVIAIGALMEKFPQLQSFLDTGLDALIQLAGGLGKMIGAFVSGALTQLSAGLPEIGANLSLFMSNAAPFIAGAKLVDETVLKGVGILAGAILLLTAADLINGIASILTFGSSFSSLGTELSMFIMNAMPFIVGSKLIDPAIMEGVKTLAEAVLILTGANVIEGLTRWLTGGNSLANFGAQLGGLGTNLNTFVSNLGTFTEAQVTTVNCAGQAIKSLAEAAKTIPNEGGLWASIVGENSLATFGGYLGGLGTNLSTFVTNLGTFTQDQVTTVDCAGKAIKALAESAKEIPNEGGLWGAIVGDNSLAKFGSHLPTLGTNLKGFITNLGTFTPDQVSTVECAGNAIKALAIASKNIPNEGGLWSKIFGDNSLTTFAGHLPGLATKLKEFVGELGEFSGGQISTVTSACDAIRAIARLGDIDIKDTGDKLEKFGSNMVKFAKKVKEFVENIGGASGESITSAINKTKDLISMAQSVVDVNVASIKTFGDSLKKFAKDGVNGFVKAFSDDEPKTKASNGVKAMIDSAIKGADSKKSDVEKKFKKIAQAAADALKDSSIKRDAKEAGKDLVEGFANGIDANTFKAKARAKAMAKAALQAAEEALGIESPSKEFYRVGNFAGLGFINALTDSNRNVYKSGYSMAESARDGLSKAISNISDIINSDIDSQPTIRPVLDLSDVESGAGYLNTMFNNGPSVGVMANLKAISSGMNNKIQNGTNNDVISAINRLAKNLSNNSGDTYNINGITYDDGSNITDAVKSLIRAAKVERRT